MPNTSPGKMKKRRSTSDSSRLALPWVTSGLCPAATSTIDGLKRNMSETASRRHQEKSKPIQTELEQYGYDPLPTYVEPGESPLSTPEVAAAYPLVLTTGARTTRIFSFTFSQRALSSQEGAGAPCGGASCKGSRIGH